MVERAYPQAVRSAARRAWQVDIGPDTRRLACTSADCPATDGVNIVGQAAQQAALDHLAAHAQHELLAQYLRTCRCHAHGCTWHPRHRGCTGPIQLTVFRRRHGRSWHLADTCTGCARLIPHAAPVPDLSATTGPRPVAASCAGRIRGTRQGPATSSPSGQAALPALLRYLTAALSSRVPSGAVILALYCLLRADTGGTALLPTGLLRALRLSHHRDHLVDALTGEHWLRREDPHCGPPPGRPARALAVRIVDPAAAHALAQLSARERRALCDATLRLLTHRLLRAHDDDARLAALRQTSSATAITARARIRPDLPTCPGPSHRGSSPGSCQLNAPATGPWESA